MEQHTQTFCSEPGTSGSQTSQTGFRYLPMSSPSILAGIQVTSAMTWPSSNYLPLL